jgi:hypothetical protein
MFVFKNPKEKLSVVARCNRFYIRFEIDKITRGGYPTWKYP